MLTSISEFKAKKNKKIKVINQKKKSRNIKEENVKRTNTLPKYYHKERVSLVGTNNQEFFYNLEKKQKLNSLKEESNKVSSFMNKLGQSIKTFNISLNNNTNSLMIANLTKISFKRSISIKHKLKNLDRMNDQFDKEYSKFNINLNLAKNYNNISKEKNKEYEKRIKKENLQRKANFKAESIKIMNILNKKFGEDKSISIYKQNKKLSELKSSIDYVCGTDSREKKKNNKNNSKKVSHYSNTMKSPSFIREKSKNASFTPSVKYNKSNVYYNKKYELVQELMEKDKKSIEKIYNTIQASPKKKTNLKFKMKLRNPVCQTEYNQGNSRDKLISESPIKIIKPNKIYKSKLINSSFNFYKDKNNNKLPKIPGKDRKNLFNEKYLTMDNKKKRKYVTFSSKPIYISLEQKVNNDSNSNTNSNININDSYKKGSKKRCNTAYNFRKSKNNISESFNNSRSQRKKIYPLLTNLLDENNKLREDLKLGFNILTNMINDFKRKKKPKIVNSELNIEQLRKDLKLNDMGEYVDEVDVVMNNVKKMEGIIKKKDVNLLRQVAKTVIREDILANKNMIYENNPLTTRLKKIYERRSKIENVNKNDDDEEVNQDKQEKIEMIRLFKNDKPDFFNEEYLSNLIKRYKSLKLK
jgi:hypothetical protein